jgi:hypothetical protein
MASVLRALFVRPRRFRAVFRGHHVASCGCQTFWRRGGAAAQGLFILADPAAYGITATSDEYRDALDEFAAECATLEKLRHPHVVQLYGVEATPGGGVYMVTEWASGGSLQSWLERHVEINALTLYRFMQYVLNGLVCMHSCRPAVLHRDVKAANVLVFEIPGAVILKLGDVGLAKVLALGGMGVAGTPYYTAPEVSESAAYDAKIDVFSFGLMFAEIVCMHLVGTGKPLIGSADMTALYPFAMRQAMVAEAVSRLQRLNKPLAELLQDCCHDAPRERVDSVTAQHRITGISPHVAAPRSRLRLDGSAPVVSVHAPSAEELPPDHAWEVRVDEQQRWLRMGPDAAAAIVAAVNSRGATARYVVGSDSYVLHLSTLVQVNTATGVRRIVRVTDAGGVVLACGDVGVGAGDGATAAAAAVVEPRTEWRNVHPAVAAAHRRQWEVLNDEHGLEFWTEFSAPSTSSVEASVVRDYRTALYTHADNAYSLDLMTLIQLNTTTAVPRVVRVLDAETGLEIACGDRTLLVRQAGSPAVRASSGVSGVGAGAAAGAGAGVGRAEPSSAALPAPRDVAATTRRWQVFDSDRRVWVPLDAEHNAAVEAAYRSGAGSATHRTGIYTNVVDFASLVMTNDVTSCARDVRAVDGGTGAVLVVRTAAAPAGGVGAGVAVGVATSDAAADAPLASTSPIGTAPAAPLASTSPIGTAPATPSRVHPALRSLPAGCSWGFIDDSVPGLTPFQVSMSPQQVAVIQRCVTENAAVAEYTHHDNAYELDLMTLRQRNVGTRAERVVHVWDAAGSMLV